MNAHKFSRFFLITMWYRIFYGIARIIAAIMLLNMIGVPIEQVVQKFMHREMLDDPNDWLLRLTNYFFSAHPIKVGYFLTVYLSFWGFMDIVLSVCILRGKMWAYPVSLILIILFVIYEFYRLSYTHSTILMVFICIDLFVFWLIWREYRHIKIENKA